MEEDDITRFEREFEDAIRIFWRTRDAQRARQRDAGRTDAGSRGAVTGGAHLDALARVFEDVFAHTGFDRSTIRRRTGVGLPGYYRPTKRWDLVIAEHGHLIAAIEFKSQVGSFGNNFNNRIEEALGSALDLRTAWEKGTLRTTTRPWLGYVFLLEEAPKSVTPVGLARTTFSIDPAFRYTSYKQRYQVLCKRLILEGLYDAVCFVSSSATPASPIHQPDPALGFRRFIELVADRAEELKRLE